MGYSACHHSEKDITVFKGDRSAPSNKLHIQACVELSGLYPRLIIGTCGARSVR